MIRTTVIPDSTDIHLSIPEDYVGRKIEIMYYPVEELTEEKLPATPMSAFKVFFQIKKQTSYGTI